MSIEIWCMKCNQNTPILYPQVTIMKNDNYLLKSNCPVCGSGRTQWVQEGGF